jgi:antitoxin HicB
LSKERIYSLVIEKQDDIYLVHFPALPVCHTWGKTYEESIKNAEEAVSVYIETLIDNNDEIPEEEDTDQPISLGVIIRSPLLA